MEEQFARDGLMMALERAEDEILRLEGELQYADKMYGRSSEMPYRFRVMSDRETVMSEHYTRIAAERARGDLLEEWGGRYPLPLRIVSIADAHRQWDQRRAEAELRALAAERALATNGA
jgi:hypothetical protein